MTSTDADLVVVGGGPGGYVAALRAAGAGLSTVLVEEGELGGVCLNVGCVPSKALIHAAEVHAGHGVPSGVAQDRGGKVDLDQLHGWQAGIVDRLRAGVAHLLRGAGVTVFRGTGSLDGPGHVQIAGEDAGRVAAGQVVLATGSTARSVAVLPFDGERIVTSTEALRPLAAEGRLVVVGGGYIGLELASAYVDLGWDVTVVEAMDRLLASMDAELARLVHRDLEARGATVLVDAEVTGDDGRCITVVEDGRQRELPADLVVVAVGRAPRSSGIGLDSVGLTTLPSGHVETDEHCRTSTQGVLAIGDLTPGPALAHAAMQQGTVAGEVVADIATTYRPAAVPAVVYTRPELATVGLTPDQAAQRGVDVEVHQVPMASNARAMTLGVDRGLARLVVERERGLVLGAQLAGPGVGEMIGTMALAIEMGAVVEDLAGTILPHPSVSEVLTEAAHLGVGAPRHTVGRK